MWTQEAYRLRHSKYQGGGYPLAGGWGTLLGGTWVPPHPVQVGGTPAGRYPLVGGTPARGHPGTPHLDWDGYPPTWAWDGYPPVSWMGYPPTRTWDGVPPPPGPEMGYPPPGPGMGIPPVSWMGYPPTWTWDGVPPPPRLDLGWGTPPGPGMGYPPWTGMGYHPPAWTWDGVPPPPPSAGWGTSPQMWTDKQTENITSSRTTYAVGKNKPIRQFVKKENCSIIFCRFSKSSCRASGSDGRDRSSACCCYRDGSGCWDTCDSNHHYSDEKTNSEENKWQGEGKKWECPFNFPSWHDGIFVQVPMKIKWS